MVIIFSYILMIFILILFYVSAIPFDCLKSLSETLQYPWNYQGPTLQIVADDIYSS